ncbi:hypothetical protein BH11ACT8_BH11ACT8_23320 [soil metagenome]
MLAGLLALVAVAVVVGLVVGGGALVATKALGLGDSTGNDPAATDSATLYLPDLTNANSQPEDYLSLPADPETASPSQSAPPPKQTKPPKPQPKITLSAAQTAVAPMERIDLTGAYQQGEGAILRVQQFEAGQWTDFPVTVPVTGGQFTTYIQASAVGLNRFRLIDTDTGETSNEVRVQIG